MSSRLRGKTPNFNSETSSLRKVLSPRRHEGHEDLKHNSPQAASQKLRVEIHQQSNSRSADPQIADDLRNVHGQQPLHGLHFQYDLSFDEQIESMMAEHAAAIGYWQ